MNDSLIVARLTRLRRKVRRRLVLYGLFAVLAGGVVAFLTVVAVDWLVWLPSLLRVMTGVIFFAGFVGATMYWIVRPLRSQLSIQQLACKLEEHFRPLQDGLASSVNFIERGDAGRSSMARHVVQSTEAAIKDLHLESALATAPVAWRGALFSASAIFMVALFWLTPNWVRTGYYRYVYPSGGIEWPRTVSILPLTAGQTVAMGESAVVRMQVSRGRTDSLRSVVHFREKDGTVNSLALHDDGEGVYSTTVDAVTADLVYWFEAGDDNTIRNPATIRVVKRPEIVEALALVEPPPYALGRSIRTEELGEGPVFVPKGGYVTVALRMSKPIAADSVQSSVGLQIESGEVIPLQVIPDDHQKAMVRFEVTDDMEFRPALRDEYGFENRAAPLYSIRAVSDAGPTVAVLEPPSVTEITPNGSIRIVVRAEDDFGIDRIDLLVELPSSPEPRSIPLSEHMRVTDESQVVQSLADYRWSIAPLNLSPSDVVIYSALVVDNFRDGELAGQESRSTPMRLKVVSEAEYDVRVREDLVAIEQRLRRVRLDLADTHDRTQTLQLSSEELRPLSSDERELLGGLSVSQVRISRQLREAAARLDEVVQRISDNLSNEKEERSRVASLVLAVRQLALGPTTTAANSLGRARERADEAAQQADINDASGAQEVALDGLREVLRSLGQWGTFQGLVGRTRNLLDRQTDIRSQTTELGKSMLGRPVESLSPEEQLALRQNQRLQEQLTDDATQHLARLDQEMTLSREKDPAGAEAIEAALRSARANEIARHLREAADSIAANRTAAATNAQRVAADALRKMLSALQERETRELAQLKKRIDAAAQEVAALIEAQRSIFAASKEAGMRDADQSSMDALVDQQRTLSRNARFLGEELMDNESTMDAGRLVRQASSPMERAAVELRAKSASGAALSQEEALELLTDAHELLLAAEQQTAESLFRRTLGEIRDSLEAMLAAQQSVNLGISELHSALAKLGRLGRSEARLATRLAREQLEVRGMVSTMLPELEQVAVYRWALERIGGWMDSSRAALDERLVNDELQETTSRIVRELEKLIGAIAKAESMPLDNEFTEAESGGGGGAGSTASTSAPVPTVSELLVLKTMQDDINERTAALYARFDAKNPRENDLRRLRTIGEDQEEVGRLTDLVTNRARGH